LLRLYSVRRKWRKATRIEKMGVTMAPEDRMPFLLAEPTRFGQGAAGEGYGNAKGHRQI